MKYFIIFNIIIVSCWSLPTISKLENKKWIEFKQIYNKYYNSIEDEQKRFEIFENNLNKIEIHNQHYNHGFVSFKMGLNQFGDLTADEFVKYATGFKNTTMNKLLLEKQNYLKMPLGEPLGDSVDWRTEGIVSQVKDQLQCGACYAFSAVGAIEGQLAKKTGTLVTLSEQNIIDCSISYGNSGCVNGRIDFAFHYVKDYGIESQEHYPYVNSFSDCKFNSVSKVTSIKDFIILQPGNEIFLQQAIKSIGPISVTIDLPFNMQFYEEGIYYNPECSSTHLKHAALVVGYGQDENKQDYYILKNSWGTTWGENGYMKLIRNHNNHCGIATFSIYPIL